MSIRYLVFALVTTVVAGPAVAQEPYSPYVGRDFPTRVFFGDTHLHTRFSVDAYGDGNTRNGPDEAYRWAKGETMAGDDGVPTSSRISWQSCGQHMIATSRRSES